LEIRAMRASQRDCWILEVSECQDLQSTGFFCAQWLDTGTRTS
jgi:hypothetical protein